MSILKNVLFVLLAMIAWGIVWCSGDVLREYEVAGPRTPIWSDFAYPVSLIVAFTYLHQFLWRWLVPLDHVDPAAKRRILDGVQSVYKRGFYSGTIGFGYLLLALYLLNFIVMLFDARLAVGQNLFGAVFFIFLGLLARARATILFLTTRSSGVTWEHSDAKRGLSGQSS